ncbi:hypothetical protein C5167_017863 [Papaver somniferum]|uniref:F-box associated beta-propeller type 3 domain-containing protein n=1 Tax=Papaver somniferum TaxID=3469 RepID=A0A4Y7IPL9_PAPSO|nr:hypothetical protein C5167_017863 [Papaver somniferum]
MGYMLYYGENDNQPNKKLRRLNQPSFCLSILGSVNGLICFSDSEIVSYIHQPIYISNPITREYMKFPKLELTGEKKVDSMVCGFGYLPSTDKYKIVRIYYIKNQPLGQVQVYIHLGLAVGETLYSLRQISFPFHCSPFGAFANGALHWLNDEQKILSFDLADEKLYLCRAVPHINSFVSLKALGEKCRSRKRYAVNPSPTEYFITQKTKDNGEFDGSEIILQAAYVSKA